MKGSTPAIDALVAAGVAHRVHRYDPDPAAGSYGAGVAAALAAELGTEPARIFKTLVAAAGEGLVVAVVPVTAELDLKALAREVGAKRAEMADPAVAERATGYVVGGISPLGQRRRLPTLVDASAEAHATVFVSGGRRGLELEVEPADLLALTGGRYARLAR